MVLKCSQDYTIKSVAVVMVNSLTRRNCDITIEALTRGSGLLLSRRDLSQSVCVRWPPSCANRAASLARLVGTSGSLLATLHHAEESLRRTEERLKRVAGRQQPASTVRVGSPSEGVVVIGSSTGGPSALQQVIPNLPESLPAGVLIVQHMPPGFTRSLAQRLAQMSRLKVSEARAGDKIEPGVALVAPGGYHMVVNRDKAVSLDTSPYVHGVRPAVDVTMESAARVFGNRCLGVVLTGMGTDGTRGASLIRRAGGKVIAQDEMTSVVYGMPRSVAQAGLADRILPIGDVAAAIAEKERDLSGRTAVDQYYFMTKIKKLTGIDLGQIEQSDAEAPQVASTAAV